MPLDRLHYDLDSCLRWGAAGAFTFGGFLYGLAIVSHKEALWLEKIPTVRTLAEATGGSIKDGSRVAVRGKVLSSQTFEAEISKKKAVASRICEVEHFTRRNANRRWESHSELKGCSRRIAPMYLDLADGGELELKFKNSTDLDPILELAADVPSRAGSWSFAEATLRFCMGMVSMGSRDQEHILPAKTKITAIGKLKKTTQSSAHKHERFECSLEPYEDRLILSRLSKSEQIYKNQWWERQLKWAAAGCAVFGVSLLGIYFIRKGIGFLQERKARRFMERRRAELERQQNERGLPAPADREENGSTSGQTQWHCAICLEADVPQTVFPMCGHVVACQGCAERLNRCPYCNRSGRARLLYFA